MEHAAFMEVIDRLITGGMKEMDALALVARMLQEESEEFISIMKEIEGERDPASAYSNAYIENLGQTPWTT